MTKCAINLSFISDDEDNPYISVKDLYKFLNYTETEEFDPVEEAYQMFLNDQGKFDISIYNQHCMTLGMPKIKNYNTFLAAVSHISDPTGEKKEISTITLDQFRKVMDF